ncbi:MAG: Holliday junction resolvase RuvX [Peptococcaceae bacterium]|jgi:putative Holliday junction resolvase|nr:Holliday junction resolvase RuvX [Peptococcaceae bacterium]MBQ2005134.1 Holliday junction resolvase RuvX [Peptococcaceae bacterium]MBQ2021892.1 Holliday junction resolvase RuvX [Peptococcaceae bacterium]MBQ2370125.1 Holliday junction resolvase RuvX [Peptococcaceae bacterium]MBQ2431684.1 Holliday junction resolvase RuvX [Peptococcaceae bacterium]
MRIMALDVGSKRIGVALSDPLKITAQGLQTFQRTTLEEDVKGLWQLIDEHEVSQLVVGLPKNMDGTIGFKAEEVQQFIADLTAERKIEIIWIDERLTTVSAERVLLEADVSRAKRKKVIDKMAAVVILQSYLDRL